MLSFYLVLLILTTMQFQHINTGTEDAVLKNHSLQGLAIATPCHDY